MTDDELKRLLSETAEETRRHFDAAVEETRRHFDVTAESMQAKLQVVAEAVLTVDRKVEDLRAETERGFTETQAMIRFSHAELD